jgi:hypothetical protein
VQTAPGLQSLPQLPQFATSLETSAQPMPQLTRPVRQAQTPSVHDCVGPQSLPQLPQSVFEFCRSTQPPSQRSRPSA